MYQGTGSSNGTVRLLANPLAIKHNMISMHVMITRDACVISTEQVLLTVHKPMAHLHHPRHQRRQPQMIVKKKKKMKTRVKTLVKKIVKKMTRLRPHRPIPGKHGRHLKRSAPNLTIIKRIAIHARSI